MANIRDTRTTELSFSCNPDDYYNKIDSMGFSYSPYIVKCVEQFIDNCFRLGKFIHIAQKYKIYEEHLDVTCSVKFTMKNAIKRDVYDKDYHKFSISARNEVIIYTVPNEKVIIQVSKTNHEFKNYNDLMIRTNIGKLPISLLEEAQFKRCRYDILQENKTIGLIDNNRCYEPLNEPISLPSYNSLPMFINTPYLKEYAIHMFKVDPPPTISYKPLKMFI